MEAITRVGKRICYRQQASSTVPSRTIRRFSKHTVTLLGFMTNSTFLTLIERLHAWRWRRRPSSQHLGCARILVKHTLRGQKTSIEDTEILNALPRSWNWPARPCQMTLGCSNSRVTLSVAGQVQTRKKHYATSSARSSSIHATFLSCNKPR